LYRSWWTAFGTEAEQFGWRTDNHDKNFHNFQDNLAYIVKSNKRRPYKLGLGPFTHLSNEEFSNGGAFCHGKFSSDERPDFQGRSTFLLADANRSALDFKDGSGEIDWVAQGAVSSVKNQGTCASCWAYAVTGVLESRIALATGVLADLSTQEILDCAVPVVKERGVGMLLHFAFDHIIKTGVAHRVADYTGACEAGQLGNVMANYRAIEPESELSLKRAVSKGPVSSAIQADQPDMQFYVSGIITGAFCQVDLNHAVVVVGYGQDSEHEYWKIKNSWGTKWGEEGYARLCRNCNRNDWSGQCGLTLQASYPMITSTLYRSPLTFAPSAEAPQTPSG
jgi:KDEL-tailed cysteine endopeptidase